MEDRNFTKFHGILATMYRYSYVEARGVEISKQSGSHG